MSEADDVTGRDEWEFDRSVRQAVDSARGQADPRRGTDPMLADGGPPTMPTEAVGRNEPTMRPDPGLPDPLNGRSSQPVRQTPSAPRSQPQPQPRPSQQVPREAPQEHPAPRQAPRQEPVFEAARQPAPQQRTPQQAAPQQRAPQQAAPQQRAPQQPAQQQPAPQRRAPQPPQYGAGQVPQTDPGPVADVRSARSAGPGPGADHRRAVAEQWADPRSSRTPANRQPRSKGRRKRDTKEVQSNRAREAKWAANRWAVPYFTDGPKVTLGLLWFVLLMGGALLGFNYDNPAVSSVAVAIVTSVVAALAGLQSGFAWFPKNPATRSWTSIAAFATGIAGFYGPWGVLIGLIIGFGILTAYLVLYRGHRRTSSQLFDVLTRSAIPVGLASASLAAMAFRNLPVLIALVLLVSAYEVGDFIVGSGAFNPIEGPMAGLIAAGVVAFFLFLIQPDPFSSESILMFVAVAAVSCVGGQYLASALLPRGNAWAPGLRRLDSYLIVAPLWLLLLVLLPDLH